MTVRFSWQQWALLGAMIFYGLFSSPTPDGMGLAEIMIALLLIGATGLTPVMQTLSGSLVFDRSAPAWVIIGTITLLYNLIVSSLLGIMQADSGQQLIRDMIPMCYGFLPLLLWPVFQSEPQNWKKVLQSGLLFIGVAFAMRYFTTIQKMPWQVGHRTYHDDFLYLPLSPEVLFAGITLAVLAMGVFLRKNSSFWHNSLKSCCLIFLSALCFASLAGMLLRAAIVFGGFALCIVFCSFAGRNLKRALLIVCAGLLILLVMPKPFQHVLDALITKEETSGLNQRDAEFRAAVVPLLDDPVSTWFGLGWGAKINSPAVGGLRVPYTHSFFSYLWVKSGLVGVLLSYSYIAALVFAALRQRQNRNAILLCSLVPLFLALTLYTSYKTLGFGLLLSFWAAHHQPGNLKQDEL